MADALSRSTLNAIQSTTEPNVDWAQLYAQDDVWSDIYCNATAYQ